MTFQSPLDFFSYSVWAAYRLSPKSVPCLISVGPCITLSPKHIYSSLVSVWAECAKPNGCFRLKTQRAQLKYDIYVTPFVLLFLLLNTTKTLFSCHEVLPWILTRHHCPRRLHNTNMSTPLVNLSFFFGFPHDSTQDHPHFPLFFSFAYETNQKPTTSRPMMYLPHKYNQQTIRLHPKFLLTKR